MRIKSLENIEQVKNLQEGDVFPVLNQGDWIDGRMLAMVEKKNENNIQFIGQHLFSKNYLRFNIKDIYKETGIIKRITKYDDCTRFWFNQYSDTPNATSELINENDSIIKRYQEAIN
jgi:hypothetical protein